MSRIDDFMGDIIQFGETGSLVFVLRRVECNSMKDHDDIYNETLIRKYSMPKQEGCVGREAIREYLRAIYARYRKASNEVTRSIVTGGCSNTGYNRTDAIRK